MPSILEYLGYKIYFWSNEKGEPIHVHICMGVPSTNDTKVWLLQEGGVLLAHNRSRINNRDLVKIMEFLRCNANIVTEKWEEFFGKAIYYC